MHAAALRCNCVACASTLHECVSTCQAAPNGAGVSWAWLASNQQQRACVDVACCGSACRHALLAVDSVQFVATNQVVTVRTTVMRFAGCHVQLRNSVFLCQRRLHKGLQPIQDAPITSMSEGQHTCVCVHTCICFVPMCACAHAIFAYFCARIHLQEHALRAFGTCI